MNKAEIKKILISMRTEDNEAHVNFLLGKLDMLSEEEFSTYLQKIVDSKIDVKDYLNDQIQKLKVDELRREPRYPLNKFFTYGINDNMLHLHLPGKLHGLIKLKHYEGTMDIVNLYLLDAFDKIQQLKENQHPHLQNVDSIYMISPILLILLGRELKFLEELDFKTTKYSKKDLSDRNFVSQNSEAQLAKSLFGTDKNVGSATINLDIILTQDWQKKKQNKVKELNDKGIFIEETER